MIARLILLSLSLSALSACGVINKRPEGEPSPFDLSKKPMTEEEAKKELNEQGKDIVYGPGLGEAAANVGGVVLFPPYGLYLLGNALLTISGYENVYITDALPEESREQWNKAYNAVTESPGRVSAAVAGEEFRSKEMINERMRALTEEDEK